MKATKQRPVRIYPPHPRSFDHFETQDLPRVRHYPRKTRSKDISIKRVIFGVLIGCAVLATAAWFCAHALETGDRWVASCR